MLFRSRCVSLALLLLTHDSTIRADTCSSRHWVTGLFSPEVDYPSLLLLWLSSRNHLVLFYIYFFIFAPLLSAPPSGRVNATKFNIGVASISYRVHLSVSRIQTFG